MKFANKKRAASTVLAGAMALSMATPAFAAGEKNTTITGTYQDIALSVTVPTTGNAIINPYGLPIELDADTSISGQQITTGAPLVISNQSKVALAVTASVKGEVKGTGVAFVADNSGLATATDKNLFVNFEAFKAPGVLDDAEEADLNAAFAALDSADAVLKANVSATAADATGTGLVLREGDSEGATQDGGSAFFRLSGEVARKANWTTADGFTTAITFTFEPSEYVGVATLAAAGDATQVAMDESLEITATLPAGVRLPTRNVEVEWSSSNATKLEVVPDTTDPLKATVTGLATTTSGKVTFECVGNDGVTYRGELTLKVVA